MREGAVIINSTLAGQRALGREEQPPGFHHWGLPPRRDDLLLGHHLSRWRIHLRRLLRGTDLFVCRQLRKAVADGYRRIYLVTQPDAIHAVPRLRAAFSDLRVATWVWVPEEVARWKRGLAATDHIFCLTPAAHATAVAAFGANRCELQVVGSEPARYFPNEEQAYEVGIFGMANRDAETTAQALRLGGFTALATDRVATWLGSQPPGVTFRAAPAYSDVFRLVARCRVCWIATHKGDHYPTGLTNIVDSLLSGVPVIVSHESPLPPQVLDLPGVHRFHPGDPNDLVRVTRFILSASSARQSIREAAASALDVAQLEMRVRAVLQMPPHAQ